MVAGKYVPDTNADGSVSENGMYLIRKDEDYWLSHSDESKANMQDRWKYEAETIGANRVVLQLIPDPIFPSTSKETPYIAWQERLKDEEKPKPDICPCCHRPIVGRG